MEKTDAELMVEFQKDWIKAQELFKEQEEQEIIVEAPQAETKVFVDTTKKLSDNEIYWLAQNVDKVFNEHQVKDNKAADRIERDNIYQNNPTNFASLGPDQQLQISPNFSDGEILSKLNAKKLELHDLEDELERARALGTEKQVDTLKKELEELRKVVEKLSNKLIPDAIKDQN
jgi:hypothetical protein